MLSEIEGKPPNKQTLYMGEQIRKAREEARISQEELAEMIYRKRLAVSEMENGKVEISAWTVPLLAQALNKPITYFYPPWIKAPLEENLSEIEQEMLLIFRNIDDEGFQRLAIKIIATLKNFEAEDNLLRG
jgi:transcriptional regulator with XRE-family HTH domain